MRGLAPLPLYAIALVVAFALFTVHGPLGAGLALAWAFIVFPSGALFFVRRIVRRPSGDDEDVIYWRTGSWQSGAR